MEVVKDHEGNVYSSFSKMCRHYGILSQTVKARLNRGCSLEDALESPTCRALKVQDHVGNDFRTLEDMCDYYHISRMTYYYRKHKGLSLAECLLGYGIGYTDHEGNEFETRREMCLHWGISETSFNSRLESGWSLEDALTKPIAHIQARHCIKVADHKGNKYNSYQEMCQHWGISYSVLRARLDYGWSMEKALTTSVSPRKKR